MRIRPFGAAVVCALVLGLAPATAARADWLDSTVEAGEIAFDVLVLRPLNLAAVAVGGVFFAAAAPMAAVSGDLSAPFEIFIYAPFEYTFLRELGDF